MKQNFYFVSTTDVFILKLGPVSHFSGFFSRQRTVNRTSVQNLVCDG